MPADFEPAPAQTTLGWMFTSLGAWGFLLPLAGLLSFVIALVIVRRGNGPMAVAALMLVVHVPFLMGGFAAIRGAIAGCSVIAMSPVGPRPAELALGISTSLFALLAGMLSMVPGYATAVLGAFLRSLRADATAGKSS